MFIFIRDEKRRKFGSTTLKFMNTDIQFQALVLGGVLWIIVGIRQRYGATYLQVTERKTMCLTTNSIASRGRITGDKSGVGENKSRQDADLTIF